MIITEKKKTSVHVTELCADFSPNSQQNRQKPRFLQGLLLFKGIWKFVTLTFAEVRSVAAVCCLETGQLNLPGGRSNFGPKPLTDSVPHHSGAAARNWKYVLHNGNAPKVKLARQAKKTKRYSVGGRVPVTSLLQMTLLAKRSNTLSLSARGCVKSPRSTYQKTGTVWNTSTSAKLSQPPPRRCRALLRNSQKTASRTNFKSHILGFHFH